VWCGPLRPGARQRTPGRPDRRQGQPARPDPAGTTHLASHDLAVGERTDGPLLARADGSRLDRHAAGRIVRRLARRAGIDKPISPHSLRHAAITAALAAGCSLRDVQDFARHADPRQTRRYDRARGALDRSPTYIVATYLAGATCAR
jgi:integrase/recombinase XerD